ncbi:hypothetical protein HK405_010436 [Cladochytrium tenue]|nr:hypothetical protein HK405_010436 [Cladochytrium tenue]
MLLFVFDVGGQLPWGVETLVNAAALAVAGGVFLLWRFQARLIYMAYVPSGSRSVVARPDRFQMPDYEDASLVTPDGVRVRAYAIFNNNGKRAAAVDSSAAATAAPCTLLYLHANAGNMGHRLPIARALFVTLGCNVVLLSYRG